MTTDRQHLARVIELMEQDICINHRRKQDVSTFTNDDLETVIAAAKQSGTVPENVMESVRWFRENYSDVMKGVYSGFYWHLQTLCDHLDPPPDDIPLPVWKRGTYKGKRCIAQRFDGISGKPKPGWFIQQDNYAHWIFDEDDNERYLELDPEPTDA